MAETLKQKTVKGLGWSALDNAARYGMQFMIGISQIQTMNKKDTLAEKSAKIKKKLENG